MFTTTTNPAQYSTTLDSSDTPASTVDWEVLPPEGPAQDPVQGVQFEILRQPEGLQVQAWLLNPDGTTSHLLHELTGNAVNLRQAPLLPARIKETILQSMQELAEETVMGALERWRWLADADTGALIKLTCVWRSPRLWSWEPEFAGSTACGFCEFSGASCFH